MTVSGAYGRDYKSLNAAKADWDSNKDFIIRSMEGSGYVNKPQVLGMEVWIRYQKDTKVGKLQ